MSIYVDVGETEAFSLKRALLVYRGKKSKLGFANQQQTTVSRHRPDNAVQQRKVHHRGLIDDDQ